MTRKPPRPSDEDHARALSLYRANASVESIVERTGLSEEQVDRAIYEGWPPSRGKNPRGPLRAFEHEIQDRLHRLELARLDWAQAVVEAAAVHAKDWAAAVKKGAAIKQAILSAWGAKVQNAMQDASVAGKIDASKIDLADFAIPIDLVRSLRALSVAMDPAQQAKIADVYRFLRGVDDDEDGVGELERVQAALGEMTDEQLEHYVETGERPSPEQKVIDFPQQGSG